MVIIDEDGILQSVCEQAVFGIIKDLAILPWNEELYTSQVFLATLGESFLGNLCILIYLIEIFLFVFLRGSKYMQ